MSVPHPGAVVKGCSPAGSGYQNTMRNHNIVHINIRPGLFMHAFSTLPPLYFYRSMWSHRSRPASGAGIVRFFVLGHDWALLGPTGPSGPHLGERIGRPYRSAAGKP